MKIHWPSAPEAVMTSPPLSSVVSHHRAVVERVPHPDAQAALRASYRAGARAVAELLAMVRDAAAPLEVAAPSR